MRKAAILFLEPRGTALEVVHAAKERGFYCVALFVDSTILNHQPSAYASFISDIDEVIEVKSWQRPLELKLTNLEIKGVYYSSDACAYQASLLRERFKLPCIPKETIAQITDKPNLRENLKKLGLSNLKCLNASEIEKLKDWPFKGAGYFKPSHGSFSAYVERVSNLRELKAAINKYKEGNAGDPAMMKDYVFQNQNPYFLEEAIEGELLSVEGISLGGIFHCLGLLSRILFSKNPVVEMGSVFPYPHKLKEEIIAKVKQAHEKLGIHEGPTHTEIIVSGSGQIEIIDLNPRFVGADVLQSINFAFCTKFQEQLLNWTIGEKVFLPIGTQTFACLQYVLPSKTLTIESIKFPKESHVVFTNAYVASGSKVTSSDRQFDYLGCYLTKGNSFEEALAKSKELRGQVQINSQFKGSY